MDRAEVTRELFDPLAQELLRTATLARLAYNGPDGFPRVVPIGFFWDGWRVVMCTAPIAPKVASLQVRSHVALTIDTNGSAARALMIRGVAEIEVVDGVPDEFLAASSKAMTPDELRAFGANARGVHKQMARISVEPAWARFYDFAAGRVPSFLLRLSE